ncbi:sulfatase [Candidatus Binatia bacterium]|nr:sulfatase [Candidatus Binatia bacterium]
MLVAAAMDAACNPSRMRTSASALLLAAAALGAADASIAAWGAAGIAPSRTLPLCLTAPFPIALVVLFPVAALRAVFAAQPGPTLRSATSLLLATAGGLAVVRGAAATPLVVAPGIGALLALGGVVCAAFLLVHRLAAAALARASRRRLATLVTLAALIQLAAVAGVAWQWCREGRGLERDLLTWSTAPWSTDGQARGGTRTEPLAAAVATAMLPRAPENLVLLTIDTLRADHLDDAHMPRTAALATEGTLFAHAFASSSWTLPSVASLMTGLPAARHGAGVARGPDPLSRAPLDADDPTLAEVLRRAGFATRAIVTNPYLGLGYGLGRGFDAYENVTLESEAVLTLAPTVGFATLAWLVPGLAVVDRGDAVTSRAARFLRAPLGGRFFLWLHYVDPHAPYDGATRSFRDELLAGGGATTRLPRMAQLRAGEIRPGVPERTALRDAYARAVRFADQQVGAVVDLLEETGMASRTLLVVTADHGEELWDHGGVEHGHTLYDEVVHVPLVIRGPGTPRTTAVDAPVATAALAPTLLDLLGVAPDADTAGRSGAFAPAHGFAALLRGDPWQASPIVSENLLFAEERTALRTPRYTYVLWPNGKQELYDRARDPGELRDLAARSALVRRHRELLDATREQAKPSPGAIERNELETTVDAVRLRRALASLGYVQ